MQATTKSRATTTIARPAYLSRQSWSKGDGGKGIETYRAGRKTELQVRQAEQVPVAVVRRVEIAQGDANAEDNGRRNQRHGAHHQRRLLPPGGEGALIGDVGPVLLDGQGTKVDALLGHRHGQRWLRFAGPLGRRGERPRWQRRRWRLLFGLLLLLNPIRSLASTRPVLRLLAPCFVLRLGLLLLLLLTGALRLGRRGGGGGRVVRHAGPCLCSLMTSVVVAEDAHQGLGILQVEYVDMCVCEASGLTQGQNCPGGVKKRGCGLGIKNQPKKKKRE